LVQYIDWPENEIADLNYENLHCNLDMDKSSECEYGDITHIEKDGKEFNF
jgi:hypothetical protein